MTGQRAAECFRPFTAAFVFSDKKAEHRLFGGRHGAAGSLQKQRGQIERNRNQRAYTGRTNRTVEQGLALLAAQRTRNLKLLRTCQDIDLNHRAIEGRVESAPARGDDDAERREFAPQTLDLG
jgi:hypothetical protein